MTTGGANYVGNAHHQGIVDCNGTDVIDVQVYCGVASNVNLPFWFGAFALPGGAQPPPASYGSSWRRLGRVVPTAAQATVDFQNLASDINDLELRWDVLNATNLVNLMLQLYGSSGALDTTTANYSWAMTAPLYGLNGTAPA